MWWMVVLGVLLACLVIVGFYLRFNPQFGGRVTKAEKMKLAASPHFQNGKFQNLIQTSLNIRKRDVPKMLKKRKKVIDHLSPKSPLSIRPTDKQALKEADDLPKFVWFGHSSALIQLSQKNFLIDPMMGPDASPIGPKRTKRFSNNTLSLIDELPDLEAILLTHDHYDHLDYQSIQALKSKCSTWLVALGVKRHLVRWGINPDHITEMDWWESHSFLGVEITFTPSRHFSGRGIFDRAQCLWGGFVLKSAAHTLYWSGDGGFGPHFSEVAQKYGPFDWFFVECGQYDDFWKDIHLFPEESTQASLEVGNPVTIPVHWGGFPLALHTWKDPIERFVADAENKQLRICTPELGEVVTLGNEPKTNWWEGLD